jgi:WD40 repeat protein
MSLRATSLLLLLVLGGCGTTAADRARLTQTPTPAATATPSGPRIDVDSADALAQTARLRVGAAPVNAVAWVPDGSAVIAGDAAGVVRQLPADGGDPESLGDDGEPILAVTATGDRIAWGGEAGVVRAVGGANSNGAARDVAEAPRGVFSLASTPAGTLAAGTGEGTVLVFGRERSSIEGLERAVDGVAFAPDGRRLAAISRTGDGIVLDGSRVGARFGYADGERGGEMHAVAWLDADRIATVSEDGGLRVWPAAGGERLEQRGLSTEQVRALAVPAGGAVFATGDDDGFVALGHAGDLSPLVEVEVGSDVLDLAFSPDGSQLAAACADGSVRLLGV